MYVLISMHLHMLFQLMNLGLAESSAVACAFVDFSDWLVKIIHCEDSVPSSGVRISFYNIFTQEFRVLNVPKYTGSL